MSSERFNHWLENKVRTLNDNVGRSGELVSSLCFLESKSRLRFRNGKLIDLQFFQTCQIMIKVSVSRKIFFRTFVFRFPALAPEHYMFFDNFYAKCRREDELISRGKRVLNIDNHYSACFQSKFFWKKGEKIKNYTIKHLSTKSHINDREGSVKRCSAWNSLDSKKIEKALDLAPWTNTNNPSPKTANYILKKGSVSVLLHPNVVRTLSKLISRYCYLDQQWPSSFAEVLPKSFTLRDRTTSEYFKGQVIFDDEGNATKDKVLVERARRKDILGKGNYFRRDIFNLYPSEVTPVLQPIFLSVDGGELKKENVIKSIKEYILLNFIFLPYDRFRNSGRVEDLFMFSGQYYKNRLLIGNVIGKCDENILSVKGSSDGSLLNSSSLILKDGEFLGDGWFPYVLTHDFTWLG